MMEPLENLYFNWLYSKVSDVHVHTASLRYTKLLGELHRIEFAWILSGDDNRAEDGVDLRGEFLHESRLEDDGTFFHDPCSVLEMLIALSRRAAFDTDVSLREWFWSMLENVNLSGLNDAAYPGGSVVDTIIEVVIWRTYTHNGNGGLFPLRQTANDQRRVELWYQCSEYIVENQLV